MAQPPQQQPMSPPPRPQYPPPGAAPPPYGYAPQPPPKKDNTLLIVVVVAVVVVVIIAVAAVLYFMFLATPFVPTTSPPTVAFGTATPSGGNVTIAIASVSRAVAFALFEVNLQWNSATGFPTFLVFSPAYSSVTVSGTDFRVYFQDTNGNFNVDQGDSVRITGDGDALPSGTYSFILLWSLTSAEIAQRTFVV